MNNHQTENKQKHTKQKNNNTGTYSKDIPHPETKKPQEGRRGANAIKSKMPAPLDGQLKNNYIAEVLPQE